MGSLGAVKERTYQLMEPGEYVFVLNDLEFSSEGQYGDSLKWVWLIASKDDPAAYFANANGMEKTLHQYTDADLIPGSRQHEWAQALSGRKLEIGDDPPEDEDLLGKRMVAYLGHYTPKKGKSAGTPREKIFESSAKAFRIPAPVAKAAPSPVTQVSADPNDDDLDRALLVNKLEKKLAKLKQLNEQVGGDAEAAIKESDLAAAPLSDIQSLLESVTAAVNAALDD